MAVMFGVYLLLIAIGIFVYSIVGLGHY